MNNIYNIIIVDNISLTRLIYIIFYNNFDIYFIKDIIKNSLENIIYFLSLLFFYYKAIYIFLIIFYYILTILIDCY